MQLTPTTKLLTSLLLLLFICLGCSKKTDDTETINSPPPQEIDLSNAVATVDGVPISNETLDMELTRIEQRFYTSATMSKDQKDQVKGEILKILINNQLFYLASQKLNISSTEEEIENGLKTALEQYPNSENFTNSFTREDISQKLAVEKFISQEFSATTIISDEQINNYYQENISDFTRPEQVFASQILINVQDQSDTVETETALALITKIEAELKAGKSFAELADQYNKGPKKMTGGQLGYIVRGQLDPVLEKASFALEPDQVSDIVQSKHGYHLLTINDKKPLHIFPLEEISDKLTAFLKQKEVQKKIDAFIKNQRETVTIVTYL